MGSEATDPTSAGASHEQAEGHRGDRLDGWKAIASHLGRDIRTVQRWEQSERLPIHRLEHKRRATAYAFTSELDLWLAARTAHDSDAAPEVGAPPVPSMRWRWVAAALALMGLVIAGVLGSRALWPGTGTAHVDTRDPQAYAAFAEGSALYWSRQYRDAAVRLENAVSRDPSYGLAWAFLGKTYGRLSQPMWAGGQPASDRAADAAARAISLAPESAETHVALSLVARSRSDVDRWRAEARRALDLDPRTAEALALLGDSYSAYVYACDRDQDPVLAESYYRRAMELRPNLVTAASNRAHNLRRMRRYTECIDLMNRTIRAFPDETPLLAERGTCRLLAGDIAGATADLSSLRGNPKIAPAGAFVYLGLFELKTGRTEEGVRDLEAVIRLDGSARAELIVAEAYGTGGDVSRASTHLKRAFDLDPACVATVATSLSFEPIRQTEEVRSLLARHGVR